MPIARNVRMLPRITPAIHAPRPPPVKVTKTPPQALTISIMVSVRCPVKDLDLRCRRKIGKRPNTSIEKRVRENTWVVEGSRDASTVDAISAELVDIDAGRLQQVS